MIGIVDYGSGNVHAIQNVYRQLGVRTQLIAEPAELSKVTRIILPGVGAFDRTVIELRRRGFEAELRLQVIGGGKPCLGICVGMQLLGSTSEEGGEHGLNWIPGAVRKIDVADSSVRPSIPHLGWNSISATSHPLMRQVDFGKGFYFLHGYHFQAAEETDVISVAEYHGAQLCAVVAKRHVMGVQFHPEKSHQNGQKVLQNFAEFQL